MARRDALLRLHKSLLARRAALRKALAGELADLRKANDVVGRLLRVLAARRHLR